MKYILSELVLERARGLYFLIDNVGRQRAKGYFVELAVRLNHTIFKPKAEGPILGRYMHIN